MFKPKIEYVPDVFDFCIIHPIGILGWSSPVCSS